MSESRLLRRRLTPTDTDHWIDLAVDMAEPEGDNLTAHYVFARKVLGEPRQDALALAAAFRKVPLTHAVCGKLRDDWERCDECRATVPGGVQLCDECAEKSA